MLRKPQTVIIKWDEKEELWHRYSQVKPFNTRRHAELWIKKNVNNGCFLAVPNVDYILRSLEEGNYDIISDGNMANDCISSAR